MGVKTVQCSACHRDMPKGKTEVVVVEGYELVICIDPIECRVHQAIIENIIRKEDKAK